MKTRIFSLLKSVAAFILLATFFSFSSTHNRKEWQMIYSRDDIKLYERWVTLINGASVREQKAELLVNAGLKPVVEFLKHAPNNTKWMAGATEVRFVENKSDHLQLVYAFFNIPWPLENRDLVLKYQCNEKSEDIYQIMITGVPGAMPEKKGIIRIRSYFGEWLIEAKGPKVKLTFKVRIEDPAPLPRYILDPVVRKSFINGMVELQKQV
jgi:hypothetical protein